MVSAQEIFYFLAKYGRINRSDLMMITGYRDPALTGTNVSFSCLPGSIFTGPNSSTCTEEGLWDPDPTQAVCKGEMKILQYYILPFQ